MIKVKNLLFFLLLSCPFCSCDNEDEKPADTVYVVLELYIYEFFEAPVISTYAYPAESSKQKAILAVDTSSWYLDGTIIHDKLFTLSSDRNLRRIDLVTTQVEVTQPLFQKLDFLLNTNFPLMAAYQDQVLVAGISDLTTQKILYLKFYDQNLNLQDSLVFENVEDLADIRVDGQKIYLSVEQDLQYFLLVMDGKDETPNSFAMGAKRCSEIVIAGDTLLAVQPEEVLMLEKSSLDVLTSIPINALQDLSSTYNFHMYNFAHNYFAYNNISHLLYFLSPAEDNEPGQFFHYYLSSLDLKSGEVKGVVAESEHHSAPLHFDRRLQTIMVCHNSGLSVYTVGGKRKAYVSPFGGQLNKLLVWQE